MAQLNVSVKLIFSEINFIFINLPYIPNQKP